MVDINELKKLRFQYLHEVYLESGGSSPSGPSTTEFIDGSEIGKRLGFDWRTTENICRYLKDEYLITFEASGLIIRITHPGITEVEAALSNPDQPTEHFLPINVIQIGSMINSQIQQASPSAIQALTVTDADKLELREILQLIKEHMDELDMNPQNKGDLEAEIGTLESQLSSSKPKLSIIRDSLSSIKDFIVNVAASATGSVIVNVLLPQIALLLSRLS